MSEETNHMLSGNAKFNKTWDWDTRSVQLGYSRWGEIFQNLPVSLREDGEDNKWDYEKYCKLHDDFTSHMNWAEKKGYTEFGVIPHHLQELHKRMYFPEK